MKYFGIVLDKKIAGKGGGRVQIEFPITRCPVQNQLLSWLYLVIQLCQVFDFWVPKGRIKNRRSDLS